MTADEAAARGNPESHGPIGEAGIANAQCRQENYRAVTNAYVINRC